MPNETVVMDSGGAIRPPGSTDILDTKGFGGCSAICAQTDEGMFGLYHLRSLREFEDDNIMVKGDAHCNVAYERWISKLKEAAHDETIHFIIGTPHRYANQAYDERHPHIGMELYLKALCKEKGIKNFDITLVDMKGVSKVTMTRKGMTCYNFKNDIVTVEKAEYQTDELILKNAPWPNQKKLNSITKNMERGGNELTKFYTSLIDEELKNTREVNKFKTQMNMLRNQDHPLMQQAILFRPQVNALKSKVIKIANQENKGDKSAALNLAFIEALDTIIKFDDMEKLQSALTDMTKNTDFSPIFSEEWFPLFDENISVAKELKALFTMVKKSLVDTDPNINPSAPSSMRTQ